MNNNFNKYFQHKKKEAQSPLISVSDPNNPLPNTANYGFYIELAKTGFQKVFTSTLNSENINAHITSILNIFKDAIETQFVQSQMRIEVNFCDGKVLNLTPFDYYFNLIVWIPFIELGEPICSYHIFFEEALTKKTIKKYFDTKFIKAYSDKINNIYGDDTEKINKLINNLCDDSFRHYEEIENFAMYLNNTINLEDNIDLEQMYPEMRAIFHADMTGVPIEDVKNVGMDYTNRAIHYIMNSNHCLADAFRAGECISPRQFKETNINIGSKPDGQGGVFPYVTNTSFINGGVSDVESLYIESHGGRTAQIIAKCNVGTSGHFARLLGLNNRDTRLHPNRIYDCGSENYIEIVIKNDEYLRRYEGRYYKTNPKGILKKLKETDFQLVGTKIYLRSPVTCASHSRGRGICYKCYGDLAYINANINIGQLAAELLSAALTQRLLSAKHLLESLVEKIEWSSGFEDLFEIDFNIIKLSDDMDYKGYTLLIDPNNIAMDSEDDEFDYNEYVTLFEVQTPTGQIIPIYTTQADPIYISMELNELIRKNGETNDGKIAIDMTRLEEANLFLIYITNNELSKTLEMIKSIINKEAITCSLDRNEITQKFIDTVIEGGLNTNAVHLEILLSNQIRSVENVLMKPDWDIPNQEYKMVTLNRALTDNPSITVSMSYQKLSKVHFNPLSFQKTAPSFMDLLFMEKPQLHMLNQHLINNSWKPKSDKDVATNLVDFY